MNFRKLRTILFSDFRRENYIQNKCCLMFQRISRRLATLLVMFYVMSTTFITHGQSNPGHVGTSCANNSAVQQIHRDSKRLVRISKSQLPDTTQFPTIHALRTQANQRFLQRIKTKSQTYILNFNPGSTKTYFQNSFNRDWNFSLDANGNNAGELKDQAFGIFTNYPALSSFDNAKRELEGFKLPDVNDHNISGLSEKGTEYLQKQLDSEKQGIEEIRNAANKVIPTEARSLYGQNPEDLAASTKVYSEKLKQKIKDSLGIAELAKYANALSTLAKKDVSEQDYINALNKVGPENNVLDKLDVENHKLTNVDDGRQLAGVHNQIQDFDLSKMRLPDSVTSQLEPLRSYTLPEKYTRVLDSLRNEYAEINKMTLDEKLINEEAKAVIAKRKSDFLQKFYAEAILSYLKDGKATLFQVSPSFGYHLGKIVSVGAGPNVLGRIEGKKVSVTMGFRSFAKAEILKQRAYLQVEDNVNPTLIDPEVLWKSPHNILTGGGVLFPISGKLALNACLMYRVNNHDTDQSSPWVFRLGLSSMKIK